MAKKKKSKNKVPSKIWKKYTVKDNRVEREKTCSRCGPGYFLAEHNNRLYCGKCKFTEFKSK